jgi:hypothetical protein
MNPTARLSLSVVTLVTATTLAHAEATAPLRPAQVIALPGVEKRIDHLAVDLSGQRLFVAALGNGTLEVIDLRAGKRIRSVPGLKEPQGVAYLPDTHKVVVANAGGFVVAFDDPSFRPLVTLDGIEDADNLRFDAAAKQLYVGYGDGALGIIDPATMKRLGDIKLPGHPESFRLEQGSQRVYVNVPRTREVVVVDRQKRTIVSHVPLGGLAKNYPMSLDEAHHRLFVGTRQPPRVLVLDTQSGRRITDVLCAGDTDDLFYDAERDRLYVIGGEGFVDVFDTRATGRYERLAHLATAAGARTGLWVPELHRLFVAAPHRGPQEAAIHVLEAPPATAAAPTASAALAADKAPLRFNFEADAVDQPPEGFDFGRTGSGAQGKWRVRAEKDAPSGSNILAQLDGDDTDYRFPVAFTGPELKDFRLSVKCKAISGKVDQGCGLVFRLKDPDNYYVTRANALEDNVRLYHVLKGNRVQFADWNGKVTSGAWHELAVDAAGDHFQIYFDGRKIIDAHDTTFPNAGKFGVWTKADSVIHFDDLIATPR